MSPSELDKQASGISIEVLSDSGNLVSSIVKDSGMVKDKRLRIVVAAIRQEISSGHGISLKWVPAWAMLADPLTKAMVVVALICAMASRCHKFDQPLMENT